MKRRGRPRWTRVPALLALAAALALPLPSPLAGQERFRKIPPLPDSRLELRLPAIESGVLSNGLTVSVAPKPWSPFVGLQLVIFAGESDSPPDLPGLAAMTARMIGRGTRVLSAEAVEEQIEAIGADFSVTVTMDYTALRLNVLEEHLDQALAIFRQIVLEPQFSDLEVSNAKRTYFYELLAEAKNPEFVGRRLLLRLLFEGHPYQRACYPKEAVPRLNPRDIAAFYGRFYRPNNAVFLLTGNLNLAVAARKVSRHFGTWAAQMVERVSPPSPAPNTGERICFIDHPGAQDASIFVGNVAMPASSPDHFAFQVLNQILGGTTGSRLFMDLREAKGYAYSAFSEARFYRSAGAYWAKAEVPRESIHAAVTEIFNELRLLSAERLGPDEIEAAKSFLIGHLPLGFESPEDFSARLADVTGLGLDDQHWARLPEGLVLVNVEKVLEVAQRIFPPVPLVVIVGNREWAGQVLGDFDVVEIYDSNGAFSMTLHKGVER
jgi:zinc protease